MTLISISSNTCFYPAISNQYGCRKKGLLHHDHLVRTVNHLNIHHQVLKTSLNQTPFQLKHTKKPSKVWQFFICAKDMFFSQILADSVHILYMWSKSKPTFYCVWRFGVEDIERHMVFDSDFFETFKNQSIHYLRFPYPYQLDFK